MSSETHILKPVMRHHLWGTTVVQEKKKQTAKLAKISFGDFQLN